MYYVRQVCKVYTYMYTIYVYYTVYMFIFVLQYYTLYNYIGIQGVRKVS